LLLASKLVVGASLSRLDMILLILLENALEEDFRLFYLMFGNQIQLLAMMLVKLHCQLLLLSIWEDFKALHLRVQFNQWESQSLYIVSVSRMKHLELLDL